MIKFVIVNSIFDTTVSLHPSVMKSLDLQDSNDMETKQIFNSLLLIMVVTVYDRRINPLTPEAFTDS